MYELTPHQLEALNTEFSVSLTANAGSGKTLVLASRYLRIILETNTSIHEIAAITFTEKAAGELYKRIAEELDSLCNLKNPPLTQKKISKLRKQLVSANISTIHSFCVNLLKEFPVEASLDANFVPIDQRTSADLIELSTEQTIKNKITFDENNEDIKVLVRFFGSRNLLAREIAGLIHQRKNLFQVIDLYDRKSTGEISAALSDRFSAVVEEILSLELPRVIRSFIRINEKILYDDGSNEIALDIKSQLEELKGIKNTGEIFRALNFLKEKALKQDGSFKIRGYLKKELRNELDKGADEIERFFKEFGKLVSGKYKFNVEAELAKYSKLISNLTLDVIEDYESKKNQMGYLDFEDILLKTKEILSNKDVLNAVHKKYRYLLVDEYQDTNEIQYEIFLPVVDYLKTGNLFIVGDEKQSIYRFRDAELEVFGKTTKEIKQANDENLVLTLPDSFRMAPAICLFTNHLFSRLFKDPQAVYGEVVHSNLVCGRDGSIEGRIEFLISDEEEESAEAELVAKRIINLKTGFGKEISDWSDIAVLSRKRSAFVQLERAFIKYGIPFTVIGGTGFYQQQSVSDIYNYFAFLFNSRDDSALVGVLRSPFFSVPDTRLFQLSTFDGTSYWEKLIDAANSDEYWKLYFATLNENLGLANRLNVPALLQKILDESDFLPTISSRKNSEQEMNNINKLISLTIKFFSKDFNSLYDYLDFLSNSIEKVAEESQAQIQDISNCVNIMTIHQAKGLQYSAIFLYRCDDTTLSGNVKAKEFKVDKNFGLLTKVPYKNNFFEGYHSAPVVDLHNFIESKKSLAELKRLLYVGITRAENFLFISARNLNKDHNKLNSFTDLFHYALGCDFKKNDFTLEGDLDFLTKKDEKFKSMNRKMVIQIPVVKNIKLEKNIEIKKEKSITKAVSLIDDISDRSKEEIISATKFSIFKDCPLKYDLVYNLKLAAVSSEYKQWLKNTSRKDEYEFNSREQRKSIFDDWDADEQVHSDLRGRIIHKILQFQPSIEGLEEQIQKLLNDTISPGNIPDITKEKFTESIVKTVYEFLQSEESRYLNSFPRFNNEFEVYSKEEDYFLFGIIDKVIFADKKIIIIDYKTDFIKESEVTKRGEKYLSQLNFYALILKRLFPAFSDIEIRVIFLRHPDNPFVVKFTESSENETLNEIKRLINSIRNNNYSVNLKHCSSCIFSINERRCIVPGDRSDA